MIPPFVDPYFFVFVFENRVRESPRAISCKRFRKVRLWRMLPTITQVSQARASSGVAARSARSNA